MCCNFGGGGCWQPVVRVGNESKDRQNGRYIPLQHAGRARPRKLRAACERGSRGGNYARAAQDRRRSSSGIRYLVSNRRASNQTRPRNHRVHLGQKPLAPGYFAFRAPSHRSKRALITHDPTSASIAQPHSLYTTRPTCSEVPLERAVSSSIDGSLLTEGRIYLARRGRIRNSTNSWLVGGILDVQARWTFCALKNVFNNY